MTLEELVSEEKKIKSLRTTTAFFIGLGIGIAVYAATRGSFILTVVLIIFSLLMGKRNADSLKRVQAEISSRENAG